MSAQKLSTDVHSSITHNSPRVKNNQMVHGWQNGQSGVFPWAALLFIIKGIETDAYAACMDEPLKTVYTSGDKASHKDDIFMISIIMWNTQIQIQEIESISVVAIVHERENRMNTMSMGF